MNDIVKEPPITVAGAILDLTDILEAAGFEAPRRLASDVIAALLEVPRSWVSLNREAGIDKAMFLAALDSVEKLRKGAPLAYAVQSAAFRHLNLFVDERVLIPRPETEVLVSEILDRFETTYGKSDWGTAIDIGTGSGAIALSLACEGRFTRVIATDVSRDAIQVAEINRTRSSAALCAPVEFRCGSLLAPVGEIEASLIVSNPPYIAFSEADALPESVRNWEPALALFSGGDGLAVTAGIVRDSASRLQSGGLLALEVDERRASLVAELIMHHGAFRDVGVRLDLAGRERFVLARRA